MGIEREAPGCVSSSNTARRSGIADVIIHHVSPETRGRLLRKGLERIIRTTPCGYPPDFGQKVQKAALLGGIVVAQNHMRNSDIPIGIRIAADIVKAANEALPEDRRLKGFVEPYAYSLQNGTQGEMSTFYSDALPLLERLGLEAVPTPTDSDLKKGRVTQEEFEAGRTKSSRRMAIAVLRDQKFIVLAPEATVKGGNINPDTGDIFGMQEFVPGVLYESLRIAARKTGYATLFTVSVSNSCGVLNSQNKITRKATLVGLTPIPPSPIPPLPILSIMSATVGEPIPFTAAEIEVIGSALIDMRVGTAIARPLKPKERGFYTEAT
jgi:hypothetical protein